MYHKTPILESKTHVHICKEKDWKDLHENVNSNYIWVMELGLIFLKLYKKRTLGKSC